MYTHTNDGKSIPVLREKYNDLLNQYNELKNQLEAKKKQVDSILSIINNVKDPSVKLASSLESKVRAMANIVNSSLVQKKPVSKNDNSGIKKDGVDWETLKNLPHMKETS